MKTDILMNGSMVKNHISLKTFLLWFQACQVRPLDLHQLQRHLRDRIVIPHHLLHPHLLHLQQVKFRLVNEKIGSRVSSLQWQVSNSVDDRSGQPDDETQANESPQKQIKRKPR